MTADKSEASLRGIDLKALEQERPTSNRSVAAANRHELDAALYWGLRRHRLQQLPLSYTAEPEKKKRSPIRDYRFTDRQLEIALRALGDPQ